MVERDLAAGVPHPRAQVAPVQLQQLVARDAPQPEEERHRGLPEVVVQVLRRGQVDLLEDVLGRDPPLQPRVEPEGDHAAQPALVPRQQGPQTLAIPDGGPPQQPVRLARILDIGRCHKIIIAAPGDPETAKSKIPARMLVIHRTRRNDLLRIAGRRPPGPKVGRTVQAPLAASLLARPDHTARAKSERPTVSPRPPAAIRP